MPCSMPARSPMGTASPHSRASLLVSVRPVISRLIFQTRASTFSSLASGEGFTISVSLKYCPVAPSTSGAAAR